MSDIVAETSILKRVDGSATVSYGQTKVIVSISGPIEPKARQELPTTAALEVLVRPDIGVSTTRERLLEDKLRAVLSQTIVGMLYPRQLIQITAQVLEAGEDSEYTSRELATIINAAYLALIDANVGIKASFAAVSIAISHNGELVSNPSKEQLKFSKSSHIVSYEIKNGKTQNLLLSDSIGTFSEDQLYQVLDIASQEIEKVHQVFRKTIQSKVERDFIWQI